MISPSSPADVDDVARHYDEIDPFYRRLWGEHLHHGFWRTGREGREEAVIRLLQFVTAHLTIRRGDHVCDVGCGYGATARYLAERFDCRVTGYTVSESQYEYARARTPAAGTCRYVLGDWMRGPLDEQSNDALLAIESSEHFADKPGFFRRALAALRPGSDMAVCAWLAGPQPKPWEISLLLDPICREGRLPGLGTRKEYLSWMGEAGFERIRSYEISRQVRRTWDLVLGAVLRELRTSRSWRYLLDGDKLNRRFLFSVLRIPLAFRTGSLRYAVFVGRRPASRIGDLRV